MAMKLAENAPINSEMNNQSEADTDARRAVSAADFAALSIAPTFCCSCV